MGGAENQSSEKNNETWANQDFSTYPPKEVLGGDCMFVMV